MGDGGGLLGFSSVCFFYCGDGCKTRITDKTGIYASARIPADYEFNEF